MWLQVAQYVRTYLGNSPETMSFIQQYWEKRECCRQQNKMIQVSFYYNLILSALYIHMRNVRHEVYGLLCWWNLCRQALRIFFSVIIIWLIDTAVLRHFGIRAKISLDTSTLEPIYCGITHGVCMGRRLKSQAPSVTASRAFDCSDHIVST